MSLLLINSNSLKIPLADESVHCMMTSPPYYGLRNYDVDGQLGSEKTPEEFIDNLVKVFRECWRVLRNDGTLWVNMGDSYAGSGKGGQSEKKRSEHWQPTYVNKGATYGLKPKDLIGIPWMLAFALRADGWYLRSDIIWSKENPMPESVHDRPTKSHEYLFLLTKRRKYFYDLDAIREPLADSLDPLNGGEGSRHRSARQGLENLKKRHHENLDDDRQKSQSMHKARMQKYLNQSEGAGLGRLNHSGYYSEDGELRANPAGRNKWTVWNIPTESYPGLHYATFPRALVEPCIKAGTSEKGVCPQCGAPWERVSNNVIVPTKKAAKTFIVDERDQSADKHDQGSNRQKNGHKPGYTTASTTLGWRPTCDCSAGDPVPAIVFDPFVGSGTTLEVARKLGRHGIGTDLSLKYLREEARERLIMNAWDEFQNGIQAEEDDYKDLPLFKRGGIT